MYPTIEADIIDGNIRSAEKDRLPARAHVLITLLGPLGKNTKSTPDPAKPARLPHPSLKGSVEAFGDLIDSVPATLWNLPR